MIKVVINGTVFQCDTPKEAAEVAKLVNGQPAQKPAANLSLFETPKSDDSDLQDFFSKISMLNGSRFKSEVLADTLKCNVKGLGPKIRGITKRLEEVYHIPLHEVLVRIESIGQPLYWQVKHENLKKYGALK
jgi:hypothetical protein